MLISPCDAIVGESGDLAGLEAIQAKGFPYSIEDLLGDSGWADRYSDGRFITLRLKSSMYHRFHSPGHARVESVCYMSGDTWNVNPPALRMVERLFCKNERVAIELALQRFDESITLVAVAAILVASVRLHGLDEPLNLEYAGPNRIKLERQLKKGGEIGYFEHGSTIIVLIPAGFCLCDDIGPGHLIRMGEPLLRFAG